MHMRFQVEIVQGEHSLDISVAASERIGSTHVWLEGMPGISLLPLTEEDPRAFLKDALVALIEHL